MPKSPSGDLHWIENQYFMVKVYLNKVKTNKRTSTYNFSILF